MSRRNLHKLFCLCCIALLLACCWQWVYIQDNQATKNALKAIPTQITQLDEVDIPDHIAQHTSVQLALANALSRGNSLKDAELIFSALIQQNRHDPIGQAAQYNLANAYLRQSLRNPTLSTQSRSMLELAKQRYRDLLRINPTHWDASLQSGTCAVVSTRKRQSDQRCQK